MLRIIVNILLIILNGYIAVLAYVSNDHVLAVIAVIAITLSVIGLIFSLILLKVDKLLKRFERPSGN